MQGHSRDFVLLLTDVCNGKDLSMGLPHDEGFWTKFSEKLNSLQDYKSTAELCERFGRHLHSFYYALQVILALVFFFFFRVKCCICF